MLLTQSTWAAKWRVLDWLDNGVYPPTSELITAQSQPGLSSAAPVQPQSVGLWQQLAKQFGDSADFNVPLEHKKIAQEINWLVRNPRYIYKVTRRSEPYAYYIVQRCIDRGLPVELALLPIVESAYDAYAYSPGRAAGLWQFIPATGKQYGLAQNWWYDGRRDPLASTEAALNYLTALHRRFDDWLLALAAYNAGPARVSRAVNKNRRQGKPTDYWSLELPKETRHYIPRLIAIREVIAAPARYDMEIYPVAEEPYFSQVDVGSQIDLAQAAKLAGVEMETLYRLNPGFSRWATPPDGPYSLLIPAAQAVSFEMAIAASKPEDWLRWQRYQVKPGDTLSEIAQMFGTHQSLIKSANDLARASIRIGQSLLIPIASETSAHYVLSQEQRQQALGKRRAGREKHIYTVKAGDSWWSIARQYKISSATLAKWNGKAPADLIRPGQKLVLWKKAAGSGKVVRSFIYRVKNGDNLSRIAARYNVSVRQILRWNEVSADRYLQPGQTLKIKVDIAGGV